MSEPSPRKTVSPWASPVTRALREGRVCIGALVVSFPHPAVFQIFAEAGFSWLYLDMEHTQLTYDGVREICVAAKLAGAVPVAGPTSLADHLVARPLDAGAMGVVAPHVETADQTADVVRWSRYPPVGTRGLIGFGDLTGYREVDTGEWVKAQNREVLVAVKIESVVGIDNVEEIASVPGLDAIIIGTGDLSATMGIPGQTKHPDIRDAVLKMLAAAKRHGVAGGPHVGSPEDAASWAEKGATFMSMGFDGALLLEASKDAVARCRKALGDRML